MSEKEMHEAPRCQHVRLSGRQCKAPARRGLNYCNFHEAEHDTSPKLTFPPVEDAASVQVAADQVLQALRDNTIEFPRASLMLSGLRLMRANLKRLGLEMGDEIENPTLAKEARVGHPESRVGHPNNEEEDLPGPSLAEMLMERSNQQEAEEAAAEGRPAAPLFDIEKAKASGADLNQLLFEKLELRDPDEESPQGTQGNAEESGHPTIG